MPRPSKQIKRSVLESRNAEVTKNERDLENAKFKASEATSPKSARRINDDKPFFKLVLPPDLLKDLGSSSDEISLRRNPTRSTKIKSAKGSPAIEILSSSGEEDFFHRSPTKEVGRSSPTKTLSSAEDNKKSLLGENRLLANSNELSQGQNLSTPRRHKSKMFLEQEKEIEMNSEDSDGDPFGFRKAEKRNMKKKAQNKISDDSEKVDVTTISQYNDNVQSETICPIISLNKENDANGSGDLCEIDKQDWNQRKQEYNALIENGKDDKNQVDNDNNQPTHDEDHLSISTEIDRESLGMTPMKTPRDKNKKEEKKMPNATSSKVKKTLHITKTADLVSLLPRRPQLGCASKKKIDNYSDIQFEEEEVSSIGEEERISDYEEKEQKRKLGKIRSEKSEKSEMRKIRKVKKEPFNWESELDEKTKQERAERIRHTEEIDSFVLAEEVVD